MKKKVFFVLCAFIINACIVLWLVREPMTELLTQQDNPAIQNITNAMPSLNMPGIPLPELPDLPELTSIELPSLTGSADDENSKPQATKSQAGKICGSTGSGQITGGKTLYRWQDENRMVHLSDTPPENHSLAVTTLNTCD